MSYAKGTTVPETKTRIEIDELLRARKAKKVAVGYDADSAQVFFELADRFVSVRMPLPTPLDAAKQRSARGWALTPAQREAWLEQRRRELWRALLLSLKAKFVAVDAGVETLEQAFLAHVLMPGGKTIGQHILPSIDDAYRTGQVSSLLLGPGR